MKFESNNQIKKKERERKIFNELFATYKEIEEQEAKEAGLVTYMAKSLIQTTLPYKQVKGNEFVRKNGNYTLTLLAPSNPGLPYGVIPRLLINWVTTEAVLKKSPQLVLGKNLADFMEKLDMNSKTGGKNGNITHLKDQMKRLFGCLINFSYTNDEYTQATNLTLVNSYKLWHKDNKENTLTLSKEFFEEISKNPIPVDIRALKVLKRSPLALDIYCWLTYRMGYLRNPITIPWELLQLQFGVDFKRTIDFKIAFLKQLKKVLAIYQVNATEVESGLMLQPSKTHIVKTKKIGGKSGG